MPAPPSWGDALAEADSPVSAPEPPSFADAVLADAAAPETDGVHVVAFDQPLLAEASAPGWRAAEGSSTQRKRGGRVPESQPPRSAGFLVARSGGRVRHSQAKPDGQNLYSGGRVPMAPVVLHDIDYILGRFEAQPLRSFAAFKELAASLRLYDIFGTARAGGRIPPEGERPEEFVSLLLEAVVCRVVDHERTFEARLGALYLLVTLHQLQPIEAQVLVPVREVQWAGITRLARELRTLRHADGFTALHTLWAGGCIQHRASTRPTPNALDLLSDYHAEREALLIAPLPKADCPSAMMISAALPSLAALEQQYDVAKAALPHGTLPAASEAAAATSNPPPPPPLPGQHFTQALGNELLYYYEGTWPHDRLLEDGVSSGAAASEGVGETWMRREAVRHRPFAPTRRQARGRRPGATTEGSVPAARAPRGPAATSHRPLRNAASAAIDAMHTFGDLSGGETSQG